jgi:hypothetical protein
MNLCEAAVKSLVAKMPRGIVRTAEQRQRPLGQFTIFSPYCASSWAAGAGWFSYRGSLCSHSG